MSFNEPREERREKNERKKAKLKMWSGWMERARPSIQESINRRLTNSK